MLLPLASISFNAVSILAVISLVLAAVSIFKPQPALLPIAVVLLAAAVLVSAA